jgi:hypothetical protein
MFCVYGEILPSRNMVNIIIRSVKLIRQAGHGFYRQQQSSRVAFFQNKNDYSLTEVQSIESEFLQTPVFYTEH